MLRIIIPAGEEYDPNTNSFIYIDEQELELEHSLVSISKWESKYHKAFLTKETKTNEEFVYYIRCMTLNSVDPNCYSFLSKDNYESIHNYIENPMTATTFKQQGQGNSRETITSELIYYWMISFGVPFECQNWHLNKLLTLIRICSIKGQPQKKMGMNDIYSQNTALNKARRQMLHSKG